ncbi:MAG: cytochrome d ubiquinol oxidase subunit II [Alphaproteobacteria bacterium]|nr:cytochrome d ubiquinol oxidase subunit II [Alphaproteobacteria bacterium]
MDWPSLWFVLLGVLLGGYAILDGFDLGVGMLHNLIAKDDTERRLVLNSIGPLWDGNEVWLVTFGGALFAAFPEAYATTFSGFYLPFVLLLFMLMFRAAAIEFRSKVHTRTWRALWDGAFTVASLGATVLMGVAVGNLVWGVPLKDGVMRASVLELLHPYALLMGAMTVALFAMHGSLFLYLKTEGELQERVVPWMWRTFGVFNGLYVLVTMATLVERPEVTRHLQEYPAAWALVALNVAAVANIPRCIHHRSAGQAFASSSFVVAVLVFLLGAALYPNLVPALGDPEESLTVYQAASSEATLKLMAGIAVLGMPMVLSYTALVYWTFRGKVKLGEFSY